MAKVMVGIPTGDGLIWSQVVDSVMNLKRGRHEVISGNAPFYRVDLARTVMVRKALRENCDYLFMADSDTIVPDDALLNLMEHGVGVCLGYYLRTDSDELTTLVRNGDRQFSSHLSIGEVRDFAEAGETLVEVKAGGMGCALIKTDVFRIVPEPWFNYINNGRSQLGEDYFFCQVCRNAGIKTYFDPRVGCGHLKLTVKEAV